MEVKKFKRLTVLMGLAVLLTACSSINCPVQNYIGTYYAMMRADGTPDTMNTDTMWIWSQRYNGTDTLLLNALCGKGDANFSLPISYTQPEDVLCVLMTDTTGQYWLDTIRIKKENIQHFESVDCQATYFHELEAASITHHAFDSVVINYPHVNYDTSHFHIYLYRKTQR